MKNSGLNGAVQWLNNNKAMLLINDRGKDVSNFWFTLFHEINHILQKRTTFIYLTSEDKKSAILSLGRNNETEEKIADKFAANKLIPSNAYDEFIAANDFSFLKIQQFADSIGIDEYIVIGRLQHDSFLDWQTFTKNRPRYKIQYSKFSND